jgi:hypothetical protein
MTGPLADRVRAPRLSLIQDVVSSTTQDFTLEAMAADLNESETLFAAVGVVNGIVRHLCRDGAAMAATLELLAAEMDFRMMVDMTEGDAADAPKVAALATKTAVRFMRLAAHLELEPIGASNALLGAAEFILRRLAQEGKEVEAVVDWAESLKTIARARARFAADQTGAPDVRH